MIEKEFWTEARPPGQTEGQVAVSTAGEQLLYGRRIGFSYTVTWEPEQTRVLLTRYLQDQNWGRRAHFRRTQDPPVTQQAQTEPEEGEITESTQEGTRTTEML